MGLFSLRVRLLLVAALATLALVVPASAQAAGQALWRTDAYDQIARNISGVGDLSLLMEDDNAEWAFLTDNRPGALGFVCILAPPGHWCYHRIFLAPRISTALGLQSQRYLWDLLNGGLVPPFEATLAVIAVIHESYHYRLASVDESRVQACTIRDFPVLLESQFRIPRTVQQLQTVPQVVQERVRQPYRVRAWVRRNGKRVRVWVTRYRWITVEKTVNVQQAVTVPNPIFETLVSTANAIHAAEPPPYGGGTCS